MELITFEYGAMSSLFSLQAENKYTAYVTMVCHYDRSAHMIALYKPVENKDDSWLNITGAISERLDEIFAEVGGFDKYMNEHVEEIKACYNTIKRLI
jgi:hypothetical protein